MATFWKGNVTATNGIKVVQANSGDDVNTISPLSFLFIGDRQPVVVESVNTSNQTIVLADPYAAGTTTTDAIAGPEESAELRRAVDQVGVLISDTEQILATASATPAPNTIVRRTATGSVKVDVSVDADDAVQKSEITAIENSLTIISVDGRRKAVEDASGGRNTVIYDDQGNPNVMVVIPRFNYEDLGLPQLDLGTGTATAFLTNGVPRSEILYGKYTASSAPGGTAVVGGAQPRVSVSHDVAKELCTRKGVGWHMSSIHESSAIALWCKANGFQPRGNTNYGRSHEKLYETAPRADGGMPGDTGGTGRTDSGMGPASWGHDGTKFGIQDLVGNVSEWQDQMKLVEGQVVATLDNDPDAIEEAWALMLAFYNVVGGVPQLNDSVTTTGSVHTTFSSLGESGTYTPNELLRRLLLETADADTLAGRFYVNNEGVRFPNRGGYWNNGSYAGLGLTYLYYERSSAYSHIGFRPAYFPT